MGEWLRSRIPQEVDVAGMIADRAFVYESSTHVLDDDPYRPHTFVWFHRELRDEAPVPGEIDLVHRDERIVVIDKPPFLSSIPRGRHVMQSVVVKLRAQLGLPFLTPAHRLDRVTSGLLVLTTEQKWRSPYQMLFQEQTVQKVYRALAPIDTGLQLPRTVVNHIAKDHSAWQAQVVPDATPNARTIVEIDQDLGDGTAVYRLTPITGRTHQLRLHMNGLGLPILGDPLYPRVLNLDVDDFSTPLQLLASEIAFDDPVDGTPRRYVSSRTLPIPGY